MSTIFPLRSTYAPHNSKQKRANHRSAYQQHDLGQGVQNKCLGPEEVAAGEKFIAASWAYLLLPATNSKAQANPPTHLTMERGR